ncbi:hypothetical protein [Streptomyces stelliscabiei]|uniref:hypothetical protein n=1 Tax=Streptomyces stelliscabiei TaxID=146820 RepID=UPI0029B4CF72|nr:hypothetical protein [Streptomyces stelliscabiei]MDX2667426.1 hypothetical protein [Streptomyces stelliscabiei]MDX2785965.1 hypothetical protein [Streptomyces stelliscabiei]
MVTRPAPDLRPGDQVRQPCGAWFTVATRPRASRSGAVLSWFYEGGSRGRAHWLAELPCRPARAGAQR